MRHQVNSCNGRNSSFDLEKNQKTAKDNLEEGGMKSSQYGLYELGYNTCNNGFYKEML